MAKHRYKDFFGNEFALDEINNSNSISQIEELSLVSLSDEEIAARVVVVSENQGRAKYAYLLEELATLFKVNNYQRLKSYYTQEDITDKIPAFKKIAVYFEREAASYNAYILKKNPDFVPLLTVAIEVLLDQKDGGRLIDAARDEINANQDPRMVDFYAEIAAFDEEKRNEFNSLFILNRTIFALQGFPYITFPTKWEPSDRLVPVQGGYLPEYQMYQHFVRNGNYHQFPHRNVMVGDLIRSPDDACLHSWGYDVLYLLQEYFISQGMQINIFSRENATAFAKEQDVKNRITSKMSTVLVSAEWGEKVFERVKHDADLTNYVSEITERTEARKALLQRVLLAFKSSTSQYTKQHIQQSINVFCDEAMRIGGKLANDMSDDSLFKNTLGNELTTLAHVHFKHQNKILRILADCVFVPLGIVSGGLLLLAKKQLTGSYFFSNALTTREERLNSALQLLHEDFSVARSQL